MPTAEGQAGLAELLRLAEWGPRQLVGAVNARLASQGRERLRLDPTAGYSWVRQGFRPRAPVPGVVAAVLTERLGYPVTVAQLWPDRDAAGRAARTAATGLDAVADVADLVGELRELADLAVTPLCPVLPAPAADLAVVVTEQLRVIAVTGRQLAGRDRVLPGQVELIAAHVAALRRLDDVHGGGALSLRYVTAELRAVIELVSYARYDAATGSRLLMIVADLAQLVGWLSFDSGRQGAAERYLLLSLGACRAAGAADRAANVIGMLSYVAAFAGHSRLAVSLAEAAMAECGKADPLLLARLLGRDATAAAADGDLARFRRQSRQAAAMLDRYPAADRPPYLYYLGAEQLAAEAGQAIVVLARRVTTGRNRLLAEAVDTLSAAIAMLRSPVPDQDCRAYPRSALLHSAFLVEACLRQDDLDRAAAALREALALLPLVQSPRARGYLFGLRPALARRSRALVARDLLGELDEASSTL